MDAREKDSVTYLHKAKPEQCFEVVSFADGIDDTKRRLEAIGMTPGSKIMVLQAKAKGTLIVRLRSCKWALGRELTSQIAVKEIPKSALSLGDEELV